MIRRICRRSVGFAVACLFATRVAWVEQPLHPHAQAARTANHSLVEARCGVLVQPEQGATSAIGYFTVTNSGANTEELLKITSPVAARVHLQQFSTDAQGIDHNWPIASLELRAGQTVRFSAQNGKHLVLEDLNIALHPGTRVSVVMQFEHAQPTVLTMIVQASKARAHWRAVGPCRDG